MLVYARQPLVSWRGLDQGASEHCTCFPKPTKQLAVCDAGFPGLGLKTRTAEDSIAFLSARLFGHLRWERVGGAGKTCSWRDLGLQVPSLKGIGASG